MKVCIFLALFAAVYAKNWALIVAGSNTYSNYRHQADVAHAWQLLTTKGGYPEAQVITMMYDDIANSPSNPVKNNLVNHPCPDCPNVYPGSAKIDYKGNDVTPANFLKVLQGDKTGMKGIGSGKVVDSTKDDNVFIFFSDHGAPGIVAFPSGGYLHADDLNNAIKKMHENAKYKEMVFYIEACESGSMFAGILPADIHVYATTASNPTESSWACYWEASRNAYLGDTYSVNFLEDSDKADFGKETFQDQFVAIKALTTQSHVMQYGDLSMAPESIGNFLAVKTGAKCPVVQTTLDQVSSRDVKLATLLKTYENTKNAALLPEIAAEYASRHTADRHMSALVHKLTGSRRLMDVKPHGKIDHSCLKLAIRAYEHACGTFDDYSLSHVSKLVNLCQAGFSHVDIHKHVVSICRA